MTSLAQSGYWASEHINPADYEKGREIMVAGDGAAA
jgi:hypothetical protein